MIGRTISHYRITDKLGEGGMGVVYKAIDTKLDRTVALKFLPPGLARNADARARFVREAKAAAALNHPDICTIYEIDEADGHTYIAMEYVEGQNLKEKLCSGPMNLGEALDIAIHVAEGLQEAHEKGMVHRDIKSANVMVTPRGRAKVMDFGLAKLAGTTKVTQAGLTVGTIAYMSPEQARGEKPDNRTDVWSLGVVLYEMLTGRLPFRGDYDQAVIYSIVNEAAEPITGLRTGVPVELERIVGKAMAKDAGERYQSMKEFAVDLRALSRQMEGAARKTGIAPVKLERKAIAVLPFKNMVSDPENEWFADGITEDIITQLSKIGELRVISRTSVMLYKDCRKSLREIGRELGVGTILEGSVRRAGNRVRIVGQLLDAQSDEHIWADTYDREMRDIFDIQSDVAKQIASALKAQLSPKERELLEKKPTDNLHAYDYYLRGREHYYRYQRKENEVAIEFFKKALELDPDYALAYAGLGDAYALNRMHHGSPAHFLDLSMQAGEKALSIDPRSAEAHKALGVAYMSKGLLQKSLEENLKAVELNPSYLPAVGNVGWVYLYIGRLDDALRWMKRQVTLGPTFGFGYFGIGVTYCGLADYDRAEEFFRKAIELQPSSPHAHCGIIIVHIARGEQEEALSCARRLLSMCPEEILAIHWAGKAELFSGNYEKAIEYLERAEQMSPLHSPALANPSDNTQLAYCLLKTGEKDRAEEMLDRSVEKAQNEMEQGDESYDPRYELAAVHAIRADKEEACRWLEEAVKAGWRDYRLASVEPTFEYLRGDERFARILAGVRAAADEMRRRVESEERA